MAPAKPNPDLLDPPPRRRPSEPRVPRSLSPSLSPAAQPGVGLAPRALPSKLAPNYHLTPSVSGSPQPGQKPVPKFKPASVYPGQRQKGRPPLPELQAYPRSQPRTKVPQATAPEVTGVTPPLPGPSVAVVPPPPAPPPLRRLPVEEDAFAPVGINVGALRLKPYVETMGGYDSNPAHATTAPKGSITERVEAGLAIQPQVGTAGLTGTLQGGYQRFNAVPASDTPDAKGDLAYKLEASRALSFDTDLRGSYATQQQGTPGLPTSLAKPPPVSTLGATLGGVYQPGALSFGLHGLVDRTVYANGILLGGGTILLSAETNTATTLDARMGYEVTGGLSPFVDAKVDRRVHDQAVDPNGFRRDSTGQSASVGVAFDLSKVLTGSISGGYLQRTYADPRLTALRGPDVEANLAWFATPLTTINLNAQTVAGETLQAGASGTLANQVTLGISHALLRNLTLGATASYQRSTYGGLSQVDTQRTFKGTLDYSLNRSLMLRASYTNQQNSSTTPGLAYTEQVFLAGLRVQR